MTTKTEIDYTRTEIKMLGMALILAEFGEHRVRVGAVAAIKRTPIAGAFNTSRNLPNVEYPNCTYHAEVNLIGMLPYEKRVKCSVYVVRISQAGKEMPSKPCERCLLALGLAGVKEIVYYNGSKYIRERPFHVR